MRRRLAAAWALVLAAAGGVAWAQRGADAGDLGFFVTAGRTLFSDDWAQAFADPAVQAGPLALAPLGAADALAGPLGVSTLGLLAFALPLVGAAAILTVASLVLRGRAWWLPAAVAGAAVLLGLPGSAFVDGHPAQLFVPLLWLVAAHVALRGYVTRAGALVGLSAGLETWGALGVAALALAPSWRGRATGAALSAAVAAALYLPFALAGEFRMLEYRWTVAEGTLPSLFLAEGSAFPWELRLLQGSAAIGAGLVVALLLRRTSHAVWAPLLGVVAFRLLLDPLGYSWYWLALQLLMVVGAAELLTSASFVDLRRRISGSGARMPMETG